MSNTKSDSKKYWIVSGLFTLLQRFSVQLFGFGSAFILFRMLSTYEMGVWVVFLTIVSFLEVGRDGLQRNALIKFLSNAEGDEYRAVATASVSLNLLITAVIVLFLWSMAYPLSYWLDMAELATVLRIYSLTTVLLMPFYQFNFMAQANLDFKGIFWSDFARQGLLFGYIVWMLIAGRSIGVVELAKVQIVTALIAAAIAWLFSRQYLRFEFSWHREWISKLFKFGKYVLATNLSTMLFKGTDKIMLAWLVGAPAAASYEAAIKVTNMTEVPTFSMSSILFPQSAREENDTKDRIKKLYEKSVGAIFALLIPCILVVLIFAEPIILIIAGAEYLYSANLLRLTILYGLFIPYAVQFGTILDSTGRPKVNFFFTLAGALLNVIVNYIFIAWLGLIGAAIGTLISYAIMFVAMQRLLRLDFNISAPRAFIYAFGFYQSGWGFLRKKTARG